jgi:hypothetical protein
MRVQADALGSSPASYSFLTLKKGHKQQVTNVHKTNNKGAKQIIRLLRNIAGVLITNPQSFGPKKK